MEVIPVLDILRGKAVHAFRGQRKEYRPLESIYGTTPQEISRNLPFRRIYVADLDAITRGASNLELIRKIAREKELLLDPGIVTAGDVEKYRELEHTPVVGTETLGSLATLGEVLELFPDLFASIDIKDGEVVSPFLPSPPEQCFETLHKEGVKNIIFLELSTVGTLSSPPFDYVDNIEHGGKVNLFLGGGIEPGDFEDLERRGAKGVLLGTALHKGLV